MEKLTHTTKTNSYFGIAISLVLFCMVGFSTNTFAAQDTTLFRIKVLQDSVYGGDTVDVEFYIGNGSPGLNILNLLSQFEFEVAANTSLIKADKTNFTFDYNSLSSFFGTTVSNITSLSLLNPITGKLNIKTSSTKAGKGNARIGTGKYIVQDNVAGRQLLPFVITKATSKGLLGLVNNAVKIQTDSVVVIGRGKTTSSSTPTSTGSPTPVSSSPNSGNAVDSSVNNSDTTTSSAPKKWNDRTAKPKSNLVSIFPNPTTNLIQVDGKNITHYRLIAIDGSTITSEVKPNESLQIDMSELKTGMYLLMLCIENNWNAYKILKK